MALLNNWSKKYEVKKLIPPLLVGDAGGGAYM